MNAPLAQRPPPNVAPQDLPLQRLYHWERTQPERIAFTQPLGGGEVRELRWREVMGQARRLAGWIQAQGYPAGSRIAILSKNTAWWMVCDYAIWMAGHISVPLYPTLAADTVRQILDHSGSCLLFIGKLDGFDGMRLGIRHDLPCIKTPLAPADAPGLAWDLALAQHPPLNGEPVRDGNALSTLMYTSGTTGQPKGVMHSFGTLMWSVQAGFKRVKVDFNSRLLSYLPLSHVVERALVEHGQLLTGMQVYFAESLDTFAADLQRAQPTTFFSVPRLWVKFQQGVHAKMPPAKLQRLLRIPLVGGLVRRKILKALGLDQCRYAVGGAAPMPAELLRWYLALGLDMLEGYGMTENGGVSHSTLPGQPRPGTVGLPYEGIESRIDPATGEIQMRSPGVMLGYYLQPELTREAFTDDGWLRTGDKGQLDAEGLLRITGRVKDLFKTSKGKYVAPAPIEDKLVMHASLEACCVTGANLGQPLGLVMLNAEAAGKAASSAERDALEASLARHLQTVNSVLDPHEQLDRLVVMRSAWTVDNGLITPTFKVKRNVVEERFGDRYESWASARQTVIWAED